MLIPQEIVFQNVIKGKRHQISYTQHLSYLC